MKILLYTVFVIALPAVIGIVGSRWSDKQSKREIREQEKLNFEK